MHKGFVSTCKRHRRDAKWNSRPIIAETESSSFHLFWNCFGHGLQWKCIDSPGRSEKLRARPRLGFSRLFASSVSPLHFFTEFTIYLHRSPLQDFSNNLAESCWLLFSCIIQFAWPAPGHRAAAAALTGLGGSLCANGPDVVKAPFDCALKTEKQIELHKFVELRRATLFKGDQLQEKLFKSFAISFSSLFCPSQAEIPPYHLQLHPPNCSCAASANTEQKMCAKQH